MGILFLKNWMVNVAIILLYIDIGVTVHIPYHSYCN